MIEAVSNLPDGVLGFVCSGQVSRTDYESVLVPAVERALKTHGKLRLYYETAPDFAGYHAGAIWEDFKIGVEHLTRWERIAVVTDIDWIRHALQFFGFLMPAQVRHFPSAQAAEARAWISA